MESKPTLRRSGSRRVTSPKLTVLGGKALALRIELRDSAPLIYRTILVPANITLRKLHVTLLWAMGWQGGHRSEEHTSELKSLMRISYAVFCLKKKNKQHPHNHQKKS